MHRLFAFAKPAACVALASLCYGWQSQLVAEPTPQVFAWGLNSSGQLGLGSTISKGLPTHIHELDSVNVDKVASSGYCNSSSAISRSGRVYTWGSGIDGILGLSEDDANALNPTLVDRLNEGRFLKVSCGGGHMAALNSEGQVFTWGLDNDGQLGHTPEDKNKNSKFYKPTFFKGGKPPARATGPLLDKKAVDVSCGRYFTVVVTESGEVYTWGAGRDHALGHGDRSNRPIPTKVEALAGERVVKIACGKNFCVALTAAGQVYTWGNNDLGQLGISKSDRCKEVPVRITSLSDIVDVVAGDLHVLALTRTGEVYSWGNGSDGELGHSNTVHQLSPKLIHNLPQVARIACGGGHSAFLTADFSLYMCGRGRDGQLGRQGKVESVASYKTTPILVEAFEGRKVLDMACGADHTLAITLAKCVL